MRPYHIALFSCSNLGTRRHHPRTQEKHNNHARTPPQRRHCSHRNDTRARYSLLEFDLFRRNHSRGAAIHPAHRAKIWLKPFSRLADRHQPKRLRTIHPFFPDQPSNDRQRAAETSLAEAIRALLSVLRHVPVEKRSGLQWRERKKSVNRTGLAGVRTLWLFDKRTGVWNLKVDVRVGGGSRAGADKRQRYHVGHEQSVDEMSLRRAGFEAWGWRRKKLQYLPSLYTERLAPPRGRKPHLMLDLDRVFDQLEDAKRRHYNRMSEYALARAQKAISGTMRLVAWRGLPIRWVDRQHEGKTIKMPDCITIEGRQWAIQWPCPDGSTYCQRRDLSSDPLGDLVNLIHDGLLASAMITVRPKSDYSFT